MTLFSSVLERFANWFQSDAGVIQSFVISTGGAILELIFPDLDPNHFWYLFICTYWSAFTCNALANSSKRNAEHDAEVVAMALKAIKDEEDQVLVRLDKQ